MSALFQIVDKNTDPKWWLKNHMATKHPETDQDVVCHVCCKCGTDLTSKQALKAHEKSRNALTPND